MPPPMRKVENVSCPVCGSPTVESLGPPVYHEPTDVAGVPIDVTDLDLRWLRCPKCEFQFIHPSIPQERLNRCYQAASMGRWATADKIGDVRFYPQKRALLERLSPGRRVLDFGCFDGGFLAALGEDAEKLGIEPATQAAKVAESRGVKIVGATLADAAVAPQSVDAVVAFDVFEHLTDPVAALRELSRMLRPGGVIMIETGNTDHPQWKRYGKRYPYASLVEHVSLFNEKSIRTAGERADLSLVHFQPSAHHYVSPRYRVTGIAYRVTYKLLRAWAWLGLPLPTRLRRVARGPLPRVTGGDHFIAVLQRLSTAPAPM